MSLAPCETPSGSTSVPELLLNVKQWLPSVTGNLGTDEHPQSPGGHEELILFPTSPLLPPLGEDYPPLHDSNPHLLSHLVGLGRLKRK